MDADAHADIHAHTDRNKDSNVHTNAESYADTDGDSHAAAVKVLAALYFSAKGASMRLRDLTT